jgi:hypothetical protein
VTPREDITRQIAVVITNYLDPVREKKHDGEYDEFDYGQADQIYQTVVEPLLKKARNKRYCGCAWCCASVSPDQRGEGHRICRAP